MKSTLRVGAHPCLIPDGSTIPPIVGQGNQHPRLTPQTFRKIMFHASFLPSLQIFGASSAKSFYLLYSLIVFSGMGSVGGAAPSSASLRRGEGAIHGAPPSFLFRKTFLLTFAGSLLTFRHPHPHLNCRLRHRPKQEENHRTRREIQRGFCLFPCPLRSLR